MFVYVRYKRGFVLLQLCCPVTMCFRVKEAFTAEPKVPEDGDSREPMNRLSPFLPVVNTCIVPSLVRYVCVYVCVGQRPKGKD